MSPTTVQPVLSQSLSLPNFVFSLDLSPPLSFSAGGKQKFENKTLFHRGLADIRCATVDLPSDSDIQRSHRNGKAQSTGESQYGIGIPCYHRCPGITQIILFEVWNR